MTNDNGNTAAAVAEPEVTEEPNISTPTEEVDEPTSDGAGEAGEGSPAPGASQDEGTSEEFDPEAIFKTEFEAQIGGDLPDTPTESTPVGVPTEKWEADRRAQLAQKHVSARQGGETWIKNQVRQIFPDATEEQVSRLWENSVKPWGSDIITSADEFMLDFDNRLVETLSDDQKAIWNKSKYTNRTEFRDKFIDIGRQEVESKYQADIKAGKLLPKATVDKALTDAGRKARASFEAWAKSKGFALGESGNEVNGSPPAGVMTVAAFEALPLDQQDAVPAATRAQIYTQGR